MTTIEKTNRLTEGFEQMEALLATYGPAELHELRRQSLEQFKNVGIPTTRDEEWKYTSLRALEEGSYAPAYGATVERAEFQATALGTLEGIEVVFVNGQYAPELSSVNVLPEGIFVGSLVEALEVCPDKVLPYLGKIARFNEPEKLGAHVDQMFVALNNAHLGEGAFIYLPKSATLESTVHVCFLSQADHGAFVAYPRLLVVAEENSQARVVESYFGLEGEYANICVAELHVSANAKIEHIRVQNDNPNAIHISNVQANQAHDSTWENTNISFGSKIARNDVNVFLDGEHTETWMNGVYVGKRDQVIDNHTRIDHAKPNCHSFEVYKGILDERSTGVFNGKIFVYEDAQKTDAKQTNQALLMSPHATINTKPQLEIFADDVKCTHGATIGQLQEDALFYLRARGIPKTEAEALLTYAFASEVIERLNDEAIVEALEKMLYQKLQEGR